MTIATVFILYLLGMIVIGWIAYRRTHNLPDYILGGRRLGRWVAALSAGASDMSGWLLLGLPGYAYAAGLEVSWLVVGLLAGTWLNWSLVARRLRVYSEVAGNALTMPEFFEQRFGDRSHLLRIIAACFILLFFLFYASSGLVAGGKLFETVFGLPYHWAVVAGASTILVYTFMGGFLAVSWTDLAQGLLMAAALLVVPVMAITATGGWSATMAGISEQNPALLSPVTGLDGHRIGVFAAISLLGWGLGYFGQPHILARFKAIRTADEIAPARRIAVGWTTLTLIGGTLVGLAAIRYLEPTLEGADTEKVFMLLVNALFHPLIAGLLLAAILAAIMSTADSQLLVSSAVLSEDFYKALLRPSASQRELVAIGRAAVIVIAVAAGVMALDPTSKVLDLVAYAWAGFGAAFGPTLILSLYWSRMNRAGALAGIVVGGLCVVVWKQLENGPRGIFDLYELVPAFVMSLAAVVVVSLMTSRPTSAVEAQHTAFLARLGKTDNSSSPAAQATRS